MVFNLTILLAPSTAASCRAVWCCSNSFFLSSHWPDTYFWCLRPWLRSSRNFADSTWPNKHFSDQDPWLKNRPAYWPIQTLNWTSSKEQWLFSWKASLGFNPFRGILVDNDLWQRATLFKSRLDGVLPCQKFALPVKDQNSLGCNKNGPSKRSKRSKMIRRQKWNLSVKWQGKRSSQMTSPKAVTSTSRSKFWRQAHDLKWCPSIVT